MADIIKRNREIRNPQRTPWDVFDKMLEQFWEPKYDISSSHAYDWFPAIDIKDEDDKYIIMADIPGVNPKDIDINLEHDILSIRGEREAEKKEKHKDLVRIERSSGTFYRSFQLSDADAENIKANYKDGVLRISIPKTSRRTSRKIEVQED